MNPVVTKPSTTATSASDTPVTTAPSAGAALEGNNLSAAVASTLWDDKLIQKHDLSGPRYTSYPTAPQFSDMISSDTWQRAAHRSNASDRPLSLYFHIPFCGTVCYYCGCNRIVTANHKRTVPYVEALKKEIRLQAEHIDCSRPVQQLHFGGGTPTYLDNEQLSDIMQTVEKYFRLEADQEGDYSIEIHPKGVTSERLAHLRAIGFNRLSMGVQDFDPGVQKAVNRFNSFDEVKELIDTARSLQFRSLNIDLIYGLPQQTPASFANTLEKIIELRPDRLSVFNYAHMPELFKTQAQINESDLPSGRDKLIILQQTIQQLIGAGYVYVGMDHFALPNDELAIAQQQGNLHRNFQGYTTRGNCDLFAFGVSSIAAFGDSYIQNLKTLDAYYTALEHDQLPLAKGITLSDDDKIRRYIIGQLMCHFELDFASVGKHTGIKFRQYFKHELIAIQQLVDDGLILLNSERLKVLPQGRLLIRRVCMMFDAYLNANPNQRSDTLVPVKQLTGETPNNAQANSAPGKSFSKII